MLFYPGGLGSGDFGAGPSDSGLQPHLYLYGSPITLPSAGTITQVGMIGRTNSAGETYNIKLGIYTAAGVLLGQTTAQITTTFVEWRDSPTVSIAVPAGGTYYVMESAETTEARYGYNGGFDGTYATEAYATAMQASEALTIGGETGKLFGVRVDFTASGGGTAQNLAGAAVGTGVATGNLSANTGTVTTLPLKNRDGIVQAGVTIPKLTWVRLSDMQQMTVWANVATSGSGVPTPGVLTLTGPGVVAGVPGLLVIANADGSLRGVHLYTPV